MPPIKQIGKFIRAHRHAQMDTSISMNLVLCCLCLFDFCAPMCMDIQLIVLHILISVRRMPRFNLIFDSSKWIGDINIYINI